MTKREKILVIWMVIMTWGHIVYNRFLIETNVLLTKDLFTVVRKFVNSFT